MEKHKKNIVISKIGNIVRYVILSIMFVTSVAPILWVALSAFKTNEEIYLNSLALPTTWRVENFIKVFNSDNLLMGYANTIINAIVVLFFTLILGSMAAYISSRAAKREVMHTYFAIGIMIPLQAILVLFFFNDTATTEIYTHIGLLLVYIASTMPITVFVLHGFMKGIPKEMEEAAIIDGASRARCFFQIIFPMSKPGLATVLTLNMITIWNDYLFSLIIGGKQELYNITVVAYQFKGEFYTDYGLICAALLFSILPLIVLYIALQENVIKGMAEGAIKA